jgi:hypothetical protein
VHARPVVAGSRPLIPSRALMMVVLPLPVDPRNPIRTVKSFFLLTIVPMYAFSKLT